MAASNGHHEVALVLLDNGADPNAMNSVSITYICKHIYARVLTPSFPD